MSSSKVFWLSVLLGFPMIFWIWSVGSKFNSGANNSKLSFFLFKFSMLFYLAYIVFAILYFILVGDLIFLLHISAIICGYYMIAFAAKSFRSAELKKKASFSEYFGELILIALFPIGIWSIQPRIQKLIGVR